MIPLYDKCPEFGNQMIAFALKDEEGLPDGDYVLFEAYCDNPACDCRNVTIQIMAAPPKVKNMATISYGWESREYYKSVTDDEETVNRLYGFHLLGGKQSERADAFMNMFEKMIRDTDVGQKIKS